MSDLKRVVTVMCVLALLCAPAAAQQQARNTVPDRHAAAGKRSTESRVAREPKDASGKEAKDSKSNEEVMAALEQLKVLVQQQSEQIEAQNKTIREQQAKMEALEHQMQQQTAGMAANTEAARAEANRIEDVELIQGQLEAVADSANETAGRISKLETGVAAQNRATEGKLRQLGNFTFSGDIRARYEPFFGGGPSTGSSLPERHRPRIRLRFNTTAKFSDEWNGGFSIATGDDADPISTNQTLTSFFQRKSFRIDKAFVDYTPGWMKSALRNNGELRITAGKFGYTWYRTELTLDNDLNPEGVSESLALRFKNPVFKGLTLVAFQLPFNESSSAKDSFMQGGQIQTLWQFGDRIKFGGYVGFYDYRQADRIRAAQTAGTLSGSTNNNAATASQFASKFGILDTIARLDVNTWSSRWPLMLQFNFASNTRACANLVNITGTLPACDASDRNAYWAEVQLGQGRETRDVQFGYTFIRIEKEAVLGAFNFSDMRAPTNNLNHRVNFSYQVNRNMQLGFTGLFGRQLVTTLSPTEERILKRYQFDAIYKF